MVIDVDADADGHEQVLLAGATSSGRLLPFNDVAALLSREDAERQGQGTTFESMRKPGLDAWMPSLRTDAGIRPSRETTSA